MSSGAKYIVLIVTLTLSILYALFLSSIVLLPGCVNEDSQNCFWDAKVRGNGEGTSFININGTYYYEVSK